jgi:signal transduction histidine kinase
LLQRRTGEDYEQIIREAIQDTERMGHLVRDLTMLARADTDASSLMVGPLNLQEVALAAVEVVKPLADRKEQTLEVGIPAHLPICGDTLKLRQALMNILENAVTYTPEGGAIRVIGRRERALALVEVQDTGPGIASNHLPHVFEPFYQVDAARSDSSHVGLGLSLTAWIVRAHGGRIEVTSQEGVGTVFTVSLPAVS